MPLRSAVLLQLSTESFTGRWLKQISDSIDSCRNYTADRDGTDLRIGIGQLASELLATNLNLATLLPSATSIPNSIRCRFADCSLDLNALAYTLGLCAILLCWLASVRAEDCVGEWAEIRNRVPNRVRLHHQIDQAFPIFRVKR